jgi:predicted DNA-binding protein (MmcQ/YjbR family)
MTNESIRTHCLSLPDTTEVIQWGEHLLFKVLGKMFAIIDLEGHSCSLRCTPETYGELVEMEDILPASHNMWKYNWVTTQTLSALPDARFRALLTESYEIVKAKLPRKARASAPSAKGATRGPRGTSLRAKSLQGRKPRA